jgi:hypothetical protein
MWTEGVENGVLKRIFGQKRTAVLGGWRQLHNEKHDNLYPPISTIVMWMRWAGM